MRQLTRALAAAVVAGQLLMGAGPAAASASRGPADDTEALPVVVTVDSVRPAAITPGATVTVTGTIATLGATVDHLHIALRARGELGRADLATLRQERSTDGYAIDTLDESAGGAHRTLRAGRPQKFRATFDADKLIGISGNDFAAALTIAVRGHPGGTSGASSVATTELGHTVLAVPVIPSTPQAPPIVSFIVPLTAAPTNPLGSAPLPTAATVGRVEAQLDGLVTGATEAGTDAPWLTLAVDPALVEQLCAAGGCDGHAALPNVPKALAAHARNALSLLRRAATTPGSGIQLTALPYADADIDAILRAGESDRVSELITDAGTQLHDLLGIAAPHVDPALPPDGELSRAAVDTLIAGGTGTAIVNDKTLALSPGVVSNVATPSASSALTGSHGLTLPALVTDPGIEDLVTAADGGVPGTAAPAAESLLAETAAITAELPNADQRSLVVLAPRLWSATGQYVHAITVGLGSATWLEHATLAAATALPGVARTQTLASSPTGELPVSTITAIARLRDDVAAATELPSATTKAATEQLQAAVREPLLTALSRASSAWWRTDPDQALALTDAVRARTQKILHGISISVASSVLVTGSTGKVPVQLENTLDFAVAVKVELSDVSGRLAPFSHVFPLPAANQGRSGKAQEELTVTSRSAGRFAAQLQLATPTTGVLLGDSQGFQVRSQNYGTLAVGITAGALFLLVVALIVRGVRALRRRRGHRVAATA
ncbi:MAG TPA: DUF6049 family protein [Mycobacteriales bacterium]|nr:DUF6049 family protein [Mycobacteriales bacterium]